jgi:hypothetical protein
MKGVPPPSTTGADLMSLDASHDLSAYVLGLLDDHLAAMQGVRERMRLSGRTSPGGRRVVALESITLAERYAESLAHALDAREPIL